MPGVGELNDPGFPDGQADLPVWELHDVVPVTADLHVGAGRDVARGQQHAGKLGEPIRQKAPLQRLGDPVLAFGLPALGDVLDGPEHSQGLPVRADAHLGLSEQHTLHAVIPSDAVLDVGEIMVISSSECLLDVRPNSRSILGIHLRNGHLEGGGKRLWDVPVDAIHLIGPRDPVLRDHPLPAPDVGDLLGLGELRLLLTKLLLGLLPLGDLVPQVQVGCVELGRPLPHPRVQLHRGALQLLVGLLRSITKAAKKNEQKATVALNAWSMSIFSSIVPARNGPIPLAAAHEATTTTSKAAGAAPRCWNRQAAHPSNGITRNIRCGSAPIATTETAAIRANSTAASRCFQRGLPGRRHGWTRLRTNGVTTRTPMASPAHHTAQEPGSSSAGSAPDATRTPVPTEALMLMLSSAPTKTMAVASRRRSISRRKPTLASKVAATRGASVLPAAVAAAGRTPVVIGR